MSIELINLAYVAAAALLARRAGLPPRRLAGVCRDRPSQKWTERRHPERHRHSLEWCPSSVRPG